MSQAAFLRGVWGSVRVIPGVPLGTEGFGADGDSLALQLAEEGACCPGQLRKGEEGGGVATLCLGGAWCIPGARSSNGVGKAVVWPGTVFP